jgi:hypothetical protein
VTKLPAQALLPTFVAKPMLDRVCGRRPRIQGWAGAGAVNVGLLAERVSHLPEGERRYLVERVYELVENLARVDVSFGGSGGSHHGNFKVNRANTAKAERKVGAAIQPLLAGPPENLSRDLALLSGVAVEPPRRFSEWSDLPCTRPALDRLKLIQESTPNSDRWFSLSSMVRTAADRGAAPDEVRAIVEHTSRYADDEMGWLSSLSMGLLTVPDTRPLAVLQAFTDKLAPFTPEQRLLMLRVLDRRMSSSGGWTATQLADAHALIDETLAVPADQLTDHLDRLIGAQLRSSGAPPARQVYDGEMVMDGYLQRQTATLIAGLREKVGRNTLPVPHALEEISAELVRREALPPVINEEGKVQSLHRLRGVNEVTDFVNARTAMVSLRVNGSYTPRTGKAIGVGELAALAWQATKLETRPQEREHLVDSLLTGIAECIEDDGHRICPTGTVQRLTRFFMGRLGFEPERQYVRPNLLANMFASDWTKELTESGADSLAPERLEELVAQAKTAAAAMFKGEAELLGWANQQIDDRKRYFKE